MIKVSDTGLPGLKLIEPMVFADNRGYFFESYAGPKYAQMDIDGVFVQDNISSSKKNTVRGLHYQVGQFAQGKLCQVLFGAVLDVAVDLRYGSPTFKKYYAVELSQDNHLQLWIPPGFAHGFAVLSDMALFHYKCTALYSKKDERAILFNDPDLNIDWKIDNPVVSEKDLQAPLFKDTGKDFIY